MDHPTSEARDLGNIVRDSDRQQFILRAKRFFDDNMDALSRDDCCSIYEQCFEFSIFSFFMLYDRSKLQKVYPSGDNSLFGHYRPRSDAKPQSPRETSLDELRRKKHSLSNHHFSINHFILCSPSITSHPFSMIPHD